MTPDDIIADIRACGTTRAFNFVFPLKDEETGMLNEFSRELSRSYPMLVPFGSLHVDTPRKDEVAEHCIVKLGLAGIKLHPYAQGFEAFSPDFEPLFRKLSDLRRPLFVHTGFDAFYGCTQDLDYLQGILDRHPDMPVVLVHSLFPRFKLAYELMARYPHLYLDMTNVPGTLAIYSKMPEAERASAGAFDEGPLEVDDFYSILAEFSGRVMFGTDHPAGMGSPEQIYKDLDGLGLDDSTRKDILRDSATRFLERHCGQWGIRIRSLS